MTPSTKFVTFSPGLISEAYVKTSQHYTKNISRMLIKAHRLDIGRRVQHSQHPWPTAFDLYTCTAQYATFGPLGKPVNTRWTTGFPIPIPPPCRKKNNSRLIYASTSYWMNLNAPMTWCTLQWRHFVQKAFFNSQNMDLNRGSQLFFSSCAHFSFTKITPRAHSKRSRDTI